MGKSTYIDDIHIHMYVYKYRYIELWLFGK